MQAITADTAIAYITHDDLPSPVYDQRRAGSERSDVAVCVAQVYVRHPVTARYDIEPNITEHYCIISFRKVQR